MDIGLARVSTLDQDPQMQISALERAGCDVIYQEKASGVAKRRPVRDQVMGQLRSGDRLTVWKLDRLGRSVVDLKSVVTDLEQRGIKFRSLTESIDTTTAQGRLFFDLLASFAEFERQLIIERTRASKRLMVEQGRHPGGARRFGMAADHETIVEDEQELLIEAAERLSKGESMSAMLRHWHTRGITAAGGGRWEATVLRNMLTNPRVALVIGQDHHQAMIRLFANAAARKRIGRPADHLLGGILRCTCGQPMYSVNTGKRQRAYRCRKAEWSGGRSHGCGRTNISEPSADRAAADLFIAGMISPKFARALDQRRAELLNGDVTAAELDEHRAEIAELEQVLPTRFGTEAMRKRHGELQRIVNQATSRLMQRPELQAMVDLPKSKEQLRAAWDGWSIATRRAWLRRVFEYITVLPATTRSRASDVASRLDPEWRV